MDREEKRKGAERMKVNEDFRKAYEEKFKEQIKECGEKIEDLIKQADILEQHIRAELYDYIKDFKAKLKEAQASLKELKNAHLGEWEKKQQASDTIWQELQNLMKKDFKR
jgi:hypothetical protein